MNILQVKKVWIVVSRSGHPQLNSVAYNKSKSIKKFVEVIPPLWETPWYKYEAMGYECVRVNIITELDDNYPHRSKAMRRNVHIKQQV